MDSSRVEGVMASCHHWRGWDGSGRLARCWRQRSKGTTAVTGSAALFAHSVVTILACARAKARLEGGGRRCLPGGSWAHRLAAAVDATREKMPQRKYAFNEGRRQEEEGFGEDGVRVGNALNSSWLCREKRIRHDMDFQILKSFLI